MPIGRMAVLISQYIRGKNRPGYTNREYVNCDKCIVVNMSDPLFTGRKRQQKVYRHHTGYPGGLKEYSFKHILETKPERILVEAVEGMLPKNKLRSDVVKKNLIMFREPYHTFHNILPQFTEPLPKDINELTGLNDLKERPENLVIKYASGEIPEEFKNLEVDIDETLDTPIPLRSKTHYTPKRTLLDAWAMQKSYKKLSKFKKHK